MTRNKPWRVSGSPVSVAPSSNTDNAASIKVARDNATTSTSQVQDAVSTSHATQAYQNESENAAKKLVESTSNDTSTQSTYRPPAVAENDDNDGEILHVYHPEDEDYVDKSEALEHDSQTDYERSTQSQHAQPASQDQAEHNDEHDILNVLGNLLGGRSHERQANPFAFLETLGGAIADSFMAPHARQLRENIDRNERDQSTPINEAPHVTKDHTGARGHFQASSSDIRIQEGRYLTAQCRNIQGRTCPARLDLNDCLSNDNGHFRWAKGGNFRASARQLELDDDGSVLRAQLLDRNGRWKHAAVWLPERVSNRNGHLVLLT